MGNGLDDCMECERCSPSDKSTWRYHPTFQFPSAWCSSSTLTLLFLSPSVSFMLAQTCRPGRPGERMSCHCLRRGWCLSESLYRLTCLGWEFKTTLMASLRCGETSKGRYLLHPSGAPASPGALGGVTLYVILMLHKSPRLALTEASGWSRAGQEGHTLAFEGRPVEDVILEFLPFYLTPWPWRDFLFEGSLPFFSP